MGTRGVTWVHRAAPTLGGTMTKEQLAHEISNYVVQQVETITGVEVSRSNMEVLSRKISYFDYVQLLGAINTVITKSLSDIINLSGALTTQRCFPEQPQEKK